MFPHLIPTPTQWDGLCLLSYRWEKQDQELWARLPRCYMAQNWLDYGFLFPRRSVEKRILSSSKLTNVLNKICCHSNGLSFCGKFTHKEHLVEQWQVKRLSQQIPGGFLGFPLHAASNDHMVFHLLGNANLSLCLMKKTSSCCLSVLLTLTYHIFLIGGGYLTSPF